MVDFIFSQPDDKQVDAKGNVITSVCYCPMMEYAAQNNIECTEAGLFSWFHNSKVAARLEEGISYRQFLPEGRFFTYKDLKEHLKNQGFSKS
jgi:hypothetical protein